MLTWWITLYNVWHFPEQILPCTLCVDEQRRMSREYRDSVVRRRRSNKSSEMEVDAIAADIEAAGGGGGARPKSRKVVLASSFQGSRKDRNMNDRPSSYSLDPVCLYCGMPIWSFLIFLSIQLLEIRI